MSDDIKSTSTKIDEAIHSKDQPLGKKAPGAPFAVVGLTYLLVLLAVMAAIVAGVWIF